MSNCAFLHALVAGTIGGTIVGVGICALAAVRPGSGYRPRPFPRGFRPAPSEAPPRLTAASPPPPPPVPVPPR